MIWQNDFHYLNYSFTSILQHKFEYYRLINYLLYYLA